MAHEMLAETRRPEWNSLRIEEAWRGQEASTSFMGSRAMPGGPNEHTSLVEEAWRGQEASESLQVGKSTCQEMKVYGEAGRGPEAPNSCIWKPGEARRP